MIGRDDINRSATSELIPLGVDDTAFLALTTFLHRSSKSLGIDNHDTETGISRETIQLLKIGTVVDKPTGFLSVVLHEVLFQHLETLGHPFTDSDAGYYNDELAPPILLVQFEHRLDIDVCFPCTCFHFDVQVHGSHPFGKCRRRSYIIKVLYGMDVLKQCF